MELKQKTKWKFLYSSILYLFFLLAIFFKVFDPFGLISFIQKYKTGIIFFLIFSYILVILMIGNLLSYDIGNEEEKYFFYIF